MGANSPEWAAVRRNAVEQILNTGRSETLHGRDVINVDGLVSRLNSLDNETIQELFGVKDAQQLRNLAADISNRSKYLDASALSPNGSPNILQQLRSAAAADQQIAKDSGTTSSLPSCAERTARGPGSIRTSWSHGSIARRRRTKRKRCSPGSTPPCGRRSSKA